MLNRGMAVLLLIGLMAVSLLAGFPAQAAPLAQTVTFPAQPYEGLQFTFTITGANLGSPKDEAKSSPFAGFARSYLKASLSGGPITVTGTATGAKGAYGYLQASLTGSKEGRFTYSDTSGEAWRQQFSFTVANPEQYSWLALNISIQRFSQYDSISVYAEVTNNGSLITPTPTLTPTPIPGKLPCPQAVRFYNLPANQAVPIQFDYADLQKQFEQALQKYEANHPKAYAQDNILGTLPALAWLANQGGTIQAMNNQFVFTSDADRAKWTTRYPTASQVTQGSERALYEAMFAAAKGGNKLSPGDVFYLALLQRNGNAKDAALLAHNTLRSLARIVDRGIFGNDDQDATLVEFNPQFIRDYLQPMVNPEPLGDGQNSGAWYHLFGVTYFEMQARGTWGAYTMLQLTNDLPMDVLNQKVDEVLKILKDDPELKLPSNRSLYSILTNEVEQLARKYFFGSPDDPMKYCYNVWGAQLGAWLYKNRLEIKSAIPMPAEPPRGMGNPSLFGPLPLSSRPNDYKIDKRNPDTWFSSSPLKITWENSQYKMVLDQASNSLYGYFPVNILPNYEEATQTWGMTWVQTGTDDYRMTLEATQSGWAHLTRTNNGQTQVYPIFLQAGETLTLDLSAAAPAPDLVRANGQKITPLDLSASSNGASTSPGACTQLRATRVAWLARDASGKQLQEVNAYPSGSKEMIPAFVYPCSPTNATIITQLDLGGKSVNFKKDLPAANTSGWFFLPLTYTTAFPDGVYQVSFYSDQTLLGTGQVKVGGETQPLGSSPVTAKGMVLDSANQQPLAHAWVAVLLPGISAAQWQTLQYPEDAVLAYGQSDSQGNFSLVDPADMSTPVSLERNTAYSIFAWLDGYQNVKADGIVINDTQPNPVTITIKMRR
jgi:hypothetical protein